MTKLLNDAHLAFIGQQEDPVTVEVSRRDIIKYSIATEQTMEKYLKGDEAPSMFIFNLFVAPQKIGDLRPDGLTRRTMIGPKLPLKRVMMGGTEVVHHRPIRPGDVLTGVTKIADLYEKEGNQGPLIFTVRERHVTDARNEPVFTERQTTIAR